MPCVRCRDRIQLAHAFVLRLQIPDSDCNRASKCYFQLNQVFCDHRCVLRRFVLNSCHRLHLDCYKPRVHCFGTIFPCRWNFIRQQHTLAELALLASVFPLPPVFRYLFKPIPELFWRGKRGTVGKISTFATWHWIFLDCWHKRELLHSVRPDTTVLDDWALNIYYLSIYLSIYLAIYYVQCLSIYQSLVTMEIKFCVLSNSIRKCTHVLTTYAASISWKCDATL